MSNNATLLNSIIGKPGTGHPVSHARVTLHKSELATLGNTRYLSVPKNKDILDGILRESAKKGIPGPFGAKKQVYLVRLGPQTGTH